MAGILGFLRSRDTNPIELEASLRRMAQPLCYSRTQVLTPFLARTQAAAVVEYGLGFAFQKRAAAQRNGVLLLIDGEVFPDSSDVPSDLHGRAATIQRAEYCLHRYLEDGPEFLERLNGTFAIAVLDTRDDTVHLGTDRFGHRLLFYADNGEQCAFASSVRSLLLLRDDIGLSYDSRALVELIVFERILGNRTLFPDIKRLPAGCTAKWAGKAWEVTRYFEPRHAPALPGLTSWNDASAALVHRLRRSLEKRLADNPKAALFLSGGLDSRLVLGCLPSPVTALTFSHPGWMPREARVAAHIARAAGAPLQLLERPADYYARIALRAAELNEGMATFVACHSIGVHRCATEAGIRVVMTGDRSDVAFKDYFAEVIHKDGLKPWTGSPSQVHEAGRRLLTSPIVRRAKHQDVTVLALSNALKAELEFVRMRTLEDLQSMFRQGVSLDETLAEMGLCDWQAFTSLGMLRGLATEFVERSPFFDNDVWDLSLQIPLPWRTGAKIVRRAIALTSPRLAAIPDVSTGIPPILSPWLAQACSSMHTAARSFAKHCRAAASGHQAAGTPHSADGIFMQSGFHNRDWALKFNQPYRDLVVASIQALPSGYFDHETIERLLQQDLAADLPTNGKLFEILLTFAQFHAKWGPQAARTQNPAPAEV